MALAAEPVKAQPAADTGAKKKAVDESIYVVQRRAYSKSGKFELTPIFFTSLNNKFVGHFGPAVAAVYHVRENFGIELVSSIPGATIGFYSALVDEVYNQESLTPEVVDLKQLSYFGGADMQFSALYGKVDLYGLLVDYDFYVTAGFGVAGTKETCIAKKEEECSSETDPSTGRGMRTPLDSNDQWKLAGQLGGGARFFFSDMLGLRLEIRDLVYSDRAADAGLVSTDTRSNVLFMLGLSVLL